MFSTKLKVKKGRDRKIPKKRKLYCFFRLQYRLTKLGYMKLPRRTSWYARSTTPQPKRGYSEAKEASPAVARAGRAAEAICGSGIEEEISSTALSTPRIPS